jgi:hypothetical protein
MPISKKNPGNPFKVASKMLKTATGKVKTAVQKTKATGATPGVVSKKDGVRTLTTTKVTGSKKAGIQSLKAKRKSGEMTRQEANAKIKNLRDVGVKPKTKGRGMIQFGGRNMDYINKLPSMDSTTFMNALPKGAVTRNTPGAIKNKGAGSQYTVNTKDIALSQMKGMQKKYPGARFRNFKYDPQTGSYIFERY